MDFDHFATVDQEAGGGTAISAVHTDIIRSHILTRLDGPTLASAGSTSSQFHELSADDKLWRDICNRTWPSTEDRRIRSLISTFPAGHRSFYSDSFATIHHHHRFPPQPNNSRPSQTSRLISAVDIHYQNRLVLSEIQETETVTGWFLCSPFRIDLIDPKETIPAPVKSPGIEDKFRSDLQDNLTLSWILIDPTRKRSGNFSSLTPVSVKRHWLTGDLQVRYATILAGELVQCGVVVTCGGKEEGELEVKEVSLQVEDMEGKNLSGMDSLVIFHEAMELGKRRRGEKGEERERYEDYLEVRRESGERKQRRERRLDMICIATGVTIFLAWAVVMLRRYC